MRQPALLLLFFVAALAVGIPSSGSARPSRERARRLIDCTCYDILRTATDTRPRTVLQNSGQDLYDLSPRRGQIIYAAAFNRLFIASVSGRGERLLDGRYSHWAMFSPDGKHVAYGVEGCAICFVDANGRNRHAFAVSGARGGVAWSPDSRQLAFVADEGSGKGILNVANADGTAVRVLTPATTNLYPGTSLGNRMTWSPHGGRIAYVAGAAWQVHVVRVSDGHDRSLGPGFAPSWSPDGRRLAFFTPGGLFVASVSGARARVLDPRAVSSYGFGATWSPGGRRIAYVRTGRPGEAQLTLIGPNGTSRQRLTDEADNVEIGPIYWSHDGQTILYTRYLQQGV